MFEFFMGKPALFPDIPQPPIQRSAIFAMADAPIA
jgi:hypothetical protein